LKPASASDTNFEALTHYQYESYQISDKMPSKVPDDGFQFGKLAKNPCSTTLYHLSNGVHATGRQLANYIPSLVHSEFTRNPTNKHTGKNDPGWMLEFSGSKPFAVKISSATSKEIRDTAATDRRFYFLLLCRKGM
jgi:hypothetical protein